VLLVSISGQVARKPSGHATSFSVLLPGIVDGRAKHPRRILLHLCKHVENPVSSSLPACRDTTCTELRIEACITYKCTNFGSLNLGRKSNVFAHNNLGVTMEVTLNNAPWCVIREPYFYPQIELHGHRVRAWRVIECAPLETDFVGRMYIVVCT
jgi:hypothetical protein